MTDLGSTPSLAVPAPAHDSRERRSTRRLARVLAPAFVVAVLGCREDAGSPTAVEPGPALTTGTAHVQFRRMSAGGGTATACR